MPDRRKLVKVCQTAILQAPESGLPNSLLYTCMRWLHRLPRSWTTPFTFPVSITFPTSSFLPPRRRACFSRALGKPQSLYQSFFVSLTSPERINVLHSKGPTCLLPHHLILSTALGTTHFQMGEEKEFSKSPGRALQGGQKNPRHDPAHIHPGIPTHRDVVDQNHKSKEFWVS